MHEHFDAGAVVALIAAIREQANALIARSLARQGITDLLPAHGAVLNALFQRGSMQMGALARLIGRKKNTVTSLINTLEERGYCSREAAPGDGRSQLAVLTAKGESMRLAQERTSEELLQKLWRGVSAEEQAVCMGMLHKMLGNLKAE